MIGTSFLYIGPLLSPFLLALITAYNAGNCRKKLIFYVHWCVCERERERERGCVGNRSKSNILEWCSCLLVENLKLVEFLAQSVDNMSFGWLFQHWKF